MKYRKKPVVIDAIQWDGKATSQVKQFMLPSMPHFDHWDGGMHVGIKTLEGTMWASPGDWIIRGIKGEFYPCKPDIFAATYELCGTEDGDE